MDELLGQFGDELTKVFNEIGEWLKTITQPEDKLHAAEAGQLDVTAFKSQIAELKSLVENSDFGSGKKLEDIMSMTGVGRYKEELSKVSKMISDYEFDEALEILEKITCENV